MVKRYMVNILSLLIIFMMICSLTIVRVSIVVSGSMEPLIHTGSVVVTTRSVDTVECEDIVLYKLDDMNVIHRVVEVNEDGTFVTKGDHNESKDFKDVSYDQIIGKYLFTIPYLGYVIVMLRSNIPAVIGIVIIFEIMNKLMKTRRNKNYEY